LVVGFGWVRHYTLRGLDNGAFESAESGAFQGDR
jgi:hypothetical protein